MPRYHQVEAVREKIRPRFSIFGWYLLPGKLYELYDGKNTIERIDNNDDDDENSLRVEEMEKRGTTKKKERKNKKRTAVAAVNEKKRKEEEEQKVALPQCKLGQRILAQHEKSQKQEKQKI